MDDIKQELEKLEAYAADANTGMTAFQIERFVVNSEPPIGRYACCCVEIQARLGAAKAMAREIETMADPMKKQIMLRRLNEALREARVFQQLADTWKPATRGLSFDELQPEYWDERLGRELCMRLITGQPYGDLIKPIMALDNCSKSKRLLLNCRHSPADSEEAKYTLAAIEGGNWLEAPKTSDTN